MKAIVLRFCGPSEKGTFSQGVLLWIGGGGVLARTPCHSFSCDEKALKEVFAWKGAPGAKRYPSCWNVALFMGGEALAGTS